MHKKNPCTYDQSNDIFWQCNYAVCYFNVHECSKQVRKSFQWQKMQMGFVGLAYSQTCCAQLVIILIFFWQFSDFIVPEPIIPHFFVGKIPWFLIVPDDQVKRIKKPECNPPPTTQSQRWRLWIGIEPIWFLVLDLMLAFEMLQLKSMYSYHASV